MVKILSFGRESSVNFGANLNANSHTKRESK